MTLTTQANLEMLRAAIGANAQRPPASAVVEALLQAEKATKQERLTYPVEALLGQWQLWFTTGTRKRRRGGIALGKGFYIPSCIRAQIGFSPASDGLSGEQLQPDQLQINNQLQIGGLCFRVTGPAKHLPNRNLLAFDFTQVQLSLWGRLLYQGQFRGGKAETIAFAIKPIAKLPFFNFFLVTDQLIAARGRGGGLAVWVKADT